MISKALFLLAVVLLAQAQDTTGPAVPVSGSSDTANCADQIENGSCNVFKPFCGNPEYLKETQLCKATCGLCGKPVDPAANQPTA